MLAKPPYPSFGQFVLALQGYEQTLTIKNEEEKMSIEHTQAFFKQRGRGRSNRGARGHFNSRGRGFTPASRYNAQSRDAKTQGNGNNKQSNNNFGQQRSGQQPHRSNNHSSSGNVIYQIYRKANHFAINCWYRFDYSYQSEDLPQALAAFTLNDSNNQSFIVDSGHFTHDKRHRTKTSG